MIRFLGAVALVMGLAACGARPSHTETLARLKQAIDSPVHAREDHEANSRLVEQAVEDGALDGLRRHEVEQAIGRGDPCSRHPRCRAAGFEDDDWFYTVGRLGEGSADRLPVLIVGFDHSGHVTRTWNLRTH